MAWLRQLTILVTATGLAFAAGAQDVSTSEMDRQKLDALRKENRYLQQRLRALEDELDSENAGDLGLRRQLDQAIKEGIELRESLDGRQAEIRMMRAALSELRDVESLNRQLEAQLEKARVRHQQQTEALDKLRPALDELNRVQADLAARDRQNRHLELALRGAEHQTEIIAQLRDNQRILQSRLDRFYEERNAALAKVQEAAEELNRLREDVQQAEAARKAAEAARAEANDAAESHAARVRVLEAALTDARNDATSYRVELNAERDKLIATVQAIQGERDALVGRLGELAGLEDDLDASSRARMQAERRAAGAIAENLRAAGELDEARARADALAAQVAALELECRKLREAAIPLPAKDDLNDPVQP